MARIFIFGLGYTALALAGQLRSYGWDVAGTTRRESKLRDLERLGIEGYLFDRGQGIRALPATLAGADYILHSIPPDRFGDPVFDIHDCDIVGHAPQMKWFGYLSSTGIYGDRQGGWVDEQTPPAPGGENGRARLEAENRWRGLQEYGVPVHTFRIAGIYGPGRNALENLQRGTATRIDKPGHIFNRIHVEDIVQVLCASMNRPEPGAIYNLADDQPAPGHEMVAYAAELLGMEPPPLVPLAEAEAAMSPMARGFYAESRKVRNDRIKQALHIKLKYPTYREGLQALAPEKSA
ncbi:MAG: SDR family NAD(P)-dependent oxidoreductase [Alphaproteobacteria bacterium]|nr:SDR family NAD(P)-dependent oxidoreductase [Alphaproteobacteria bacterium]